MELHDLTTSHVSALIRDGEISPVELMRHLLEQIRNLEPQLKAWVTLNEKTSLDQARESEKELRAQGPRGMLHGVPIGIKDIYYTKDMPTTACTPQYAGFIPSYDATSITKLKAAGAIILGKTVTTQFAATDPSPTINPWNRDHTPGGSSSGSAVAVASRMCSAALGSQTAGSTIRPAAYNGIVGFKPTYGRISKYGIVPLSWSLDTVGILTRSAEDCAILLQVLSGHDPKDHSSSNLPSDDYMTGLNRLENPPKIGVAHEFFSENADEEVRIHTDFVVELLRTAGAAISKVKLPNEFLTHETARNTVLSAEAATFHREMFSENPTDYGPLLSQIIKDGLNVTAVEYIQAQRVRSRFRFAVEPLFRDVDVIITPTTPTSAPRDRSVTGDPMFQGSWTSCGLPTITMPCGLDKTGMPLGIQLISRHYDEARLLRIAHWCETTLGITLTPFPNKPGGVPQKDID